jgi:hypothetical protein
MRDRTDRYSIQGMPSVSSSAKKIGGYLLDAGLLTTDQVNVVLNDQQATGMRFGEIVVARGWMKEQTIEWIMTKVVEPERQALEPPVAATGWVNQPQPRSNALTPTAAPLRTVPQPPATPRVAASAPPPPTTPKIAAKVTDASLQKGFSRRDAPIAKPLPSVNSADGDVNWVG